MIFLTLGIATAGIMLPQSAALGHGGGTDDSGGHWCRVGSCAGTYHYHGGGYSGGGSSSRSMSPQERSREQAARRRDNTIVSRRVIGEDWWQGAKYFVVLITYASGRTALEQVSQIASAVPGSTGGASPQAPTTTSTTTTLAPSAPPQIVGLSLGRDYDRETQYGVVGTGRYMRQVVQVKVIVDRRSFPLQFCWDVTADKAKLPWWHWGFRPWPEPNNNAGTGCFIIHEIQDFSPDGTLTAEMQIDYRDKDWYFPVPYVQREFGVLVTLTDRDGRSTTSETLTFVK